MASYSKMLADGILIPVFQSATKSGLRKAISLIIIGAIIYYIRKKSMKVAIDPNLAGADGKIKKKKSKGTVDKQFFTRIMRLVRIVIPTWKSREVLNLSGLTLALVLRTFLSIYLASINGAVVKAIVNINFKDFIQSVVFLGLFSIPASTVNSSMDFFSKNLTLLFRDRLTQHFNGKYLDKMIYYQICNLDNRIKNPDQRLTQDIEKWANSLSTLYSNFSKPLLDIVLFSRKLAELVGWQGPAMMIAWYFMSGVVIRFITPTFGKLVAIQQNLEGDYRATHSDLLNHSEEIAFYKGSEWEKKRINKTYNDLHVHIEKVMKSRFYMGIFDSMITKYGAVLVGYTILGLPVFGPGREDYIKMVSSDPSRITRDYVRNSSMLISLAKAIGRIVVSYKELQNLAGYTSLVFELEEVLQDLDVGKYKRSLVKSSDKPQIDMSLRGEYLPSESIKFENVPIISPNGDILIEAINFEVSKGMNLFITGPNGCGKSSLFRIMGSLWPLFGGKVHRPKEESIFYIPQRPYLPTGTLRDQIIYPHNKMNMRKKRVTDTKLKQLLDIVQLKSYADKNDGKGLDVFSNWNDVLSGGEKQRIAMARLFYHKPMFAILDECTSAVSLDIEAIMYKHSKELGISLITVSHRPTLWKYHEYLLRMDGEGDWSFESLENNPAAK
jgi:ATP-binding cassette subfamily D (ALD) protein 3